MSSYAGFLARFVVGAQNALSTLVANVLFRNSETKQPSRILLLRTAALGDFVMTIPALVVLRERFPSARITLLTTPTTKRAMRSKVARYAGSDASLPWLSLAEPSLINETIVWTGSITRVIGDLRRQVRQLNPDATFMLTDVGAPMKGILSKILFLRFVGVRGPVFGWRRRASRAVLPLGRAAEALFEHHTMGPIDSVAEHPAVGDRSALAVRHCLAISPDALAWANQLWISNDWGKRRVVAIAPGSIQAHKQWPITKFVALCKALVERFEIDLVVVGTRDDQALGASLEEAIGGRLKNLAGATTIEQSAALLSRCSLLVGNDGGAMHLGAAAGCKVVSIIPGIELPGSVEPWGCQDFAVRQPVDCAPCYSFTHCPRGHRRCMTDLPVEKVLEKCTTVLAA